jgi:hypothetical protein
MSALVSSTDATPNFLLLIDFKHPLFFSLLTREEPVEHAPPPQGLQESTAIPLFEAMIRPGSKPGFGFAY